MRFSRSAPVKPGVPRASWPRSTSSARGLALGVDLQDLLPAPDVGQAHVHLPVEPTGPQQRRVQHIRPVGGRQDHHTFVSGKAVHLHQQLIQGLLPLVMAAAQARAPAGGPQRRSRQ